MLALLYVCLLGAANAAGAAEKYRYRATTGDNVEIIYTTIERRGDCVAITNVRGKKVNTFRCRPDSDTIEWEIVDRPRDVAVEARRAGNTILVKGKYEGKSVDKKKDIDARPWYQSIPFSLSAFAASGKETLTFWTLDPDNQNAIKMKATRKSIENVNVTGIVYKARKVSVRLTGIKSIFWQADFWYRTSDGLFVKFEGNKGPGTPHTVIELTYGGNK